MSGYPRARSERLITEEVDDELLIYDETTQTAHALSTEACSVWNLCDGHSSVKDIARRLGLEQTRVSQALDELSAAGLIEEPEGISRRIFYKRTAKLGAAALSAPLIYSVAIPAAGAAASTCVGTACLLLWSGNNTCSGPASADTCVTQVGLPPGCTCQNLGSCQDLAGVASQKAGTCM